MDQQQVQEKAEDLLSSAEREDMDALYRELNSMNRADSLAVRREIKESGYRGLEQFPELTIGLQEGGKMLFDCLDQKSFIRPHSDELSAGSQFEVDYREAFDSKKETVIPISEVDAKFGKWEARQYKNAGVQTIRLGEKHVILELKKPYETGIWPLYNLKIDKTFSFNFSGQRNNSNLSNIHGFELDKKIVTAIEFKGNKMVVRTEDKKTSEYKLSGKKADVIAGLLWPLMRKNLRK